MIIKMDKWYKRVFTKIMWKLGIWKPPKYGKGVYCERGIQIMCFDGNPTIFKRVNDSIVLIDKQ